MNSYSTHGELSDSICDISQSVQSTPHTPTSGVCEPHPPPLMHSMQKPCHEMDQLVSYSPYNSYPHDDILAQSVQQTLGKLFKYCIKNIVPALLKVALEL